MISLFFFQFEQGHFLKLTIVLDNARAQVTLGPMVLARIPSFSPFPSYLIRQSAEIAAQGRGFLPSRTRMRG